MKKLKSNWYQNHKGYLEPFARTPSDEGANGSVTVTRGVKITAHAWYNHVVSQFDSIDSVNETDSMVFPYQITISVVHGSADAENEEERFYPCILQTRTWNLTDGDKKNKVDN